MFFIYNYNFLYKNFNLKKTSNFESGFDRLDLINFIFNINFFLIILIFIIFDIELIIFIYFIYENFNLLLFLVL